MCKSDNEPPKADLEIDFKDIKFKVNDNDVIFFNGNNWMYKMNKSLGMSRSITSHVNEEQTNQEDEENIKNLKKEIEEKNSRIDELKNKIKEIDGKIQTMNKILNIDVSEQEYVKELSDKINNEKNQE